MQKKSFEITNKCSNEFIVQISPQSFGISFKYFGFFKPTMTKQLLTNFVIKFIYTEVLIKIVYARTILSPDRAILI